MTSTLRRLGQWKRRRHRNAAVIFATQCLQYSPRHLPGATIPAHLLRRKKHRARCVPPNLPILHVAQLHLSRHLHRPEHQRVPARLRRLLRRSLLQCAAPGGGIPVNLRIGGLSQPIVIQTLAVPHHEAARAGARADTVRSRHGGERLRSTTARGRFILFDDEVFERKEFAAENDVIGGAHVGAAAAAEAVENLAGVIV